MDDEHLKLGKRLLSLIGLANAPEQFNDAKCQVEEEAKKDTLEEAEEKHEAEKEAKNEHAAQESQRLKEIRARQDRKNKKAKNQWITTPEDDNYNVDDVMKKITYD
ncbi:hypothetical protein Tco_0473029 [Tanacetum coccineum]